MKVKSLILLAALVLAGCQSSRTERVGNFIITHQRPGSMQMADGRAVRGVFDLADFHYVYPWEPLAHPESQAIMAANRIPQRIQKLSGKEITLVGAFLPLSVDKKLKIREGLFLPNKSTGCPPAPVQNINEWLYIPEMVMGRELFALGSRNHFLITGKFIIKMETENGYLVGLYRLEDVRFHKLENIDMSRIKNAKALKQQYTIYFSVGQSSHRKPFTGTVIEMDALGQPVREVKLVGGIPIRERRFQHKTANAE